MTESSSHDHILHYVARGYDASNNIWLRQARKIVQATANLFHQCGSTTLTIARRKAPARRLIARPQCKQWQCNNHFLLSYHKEQWQQQTNAKEDQTDSHATIKLSCCRLRDATMTVLHHMMTSGTSMLRLSTGSMPKTDCTLPKACMSQKANTLSTPKRSCTLPRASMVSIGFYAVACKSIFLLNYKKQQYQKKTVVPRVCKLLALRWRRGLYFLCRIVMSKRQWYNVFIVLRGSKQWPCGIVREQASVHCIARANKDNIQPSGGCKVHLQWYGDDGPPRNNQSFICCRAQEATTLSISLCRIATREQQQLNFLHQLQGNKQRQLNG